MPSEILPILALQCSGCHNPLPAPVCNTGEPVRCPHCNALIRVEIYPAILKSSGGTGSLGRDISEGEASCFYHPEKQAVKVCGSCGRFLCSLCEIELAGRCLCPVCLEDGRKKEEIQELIPRRTLYDSMALSISLLPVIFFPLTIITAPLALFFAVKAWRRPGSILPRTRIRAIIAMIISLLQIGGWVAFAASFFW